MPVRQNSLPAGPGGRKMPQRKATQFMAGPGLAPPQEEPQESTESGGKNERAISVLNHTIETINLANNLIPLDLAKGVLSTVASLLTLVKTTIQNKNDFVGISEQCNKISMMLWRATEGKGPEDISLPVRTAIAELKRSVDGILNVVQEKIQSHIGSQVFHATINQESISGWQQELDRFLLLFNTELNLASNSKMDQLAVKFDEIRERMSIRTAEVPVPVAIPPKPPVFVGREEIVQEVTQNLIKQQSVALIGPGGMGKTFIARAVLNEPTIVNAFGQRRYFARYDDIDGSQITYGTFVNRLAMAIGLPGAKGKAIALVNIALTSQQQTMLVLDNAETFLDAEHDGGAIADCINEIGAIPNLVLLMTSRSTILPSNLRWDRVRVPALDQTPASDLFKEVYHKDIAEELLDGLLKSVDFHPLSINLLAQVGVQNDWTPDELSKAWEQQQAGLLDTGAGKIQSLATTIQLSVKSPSLQKHGDVVSQILPVIAFLPQGLYKARLDAMFPSIPHIQTIIDLLCKHSLTYVKGDFITMLAPIRLHFTRDLVRLGEMTMLNQVYNYFVAELSNDPVDGEWFQLEDINIEHLYGTLLQHAITTGNTVYAAEVADTTAHYIQSLSGIRPRPTSLRPIVMALQIEESRTFMDHLNYKRHKRRQHSAGMKGKCVLFLGILSFAIGTLEDARGLMLEAARTFEHSNILSRHHFRFLTFAVAATHMSLGNFAETQKALEADFSDLDLRWKPWRREDVDLAVPLVLETIKIYRGQSKDAEQLFKFAKAVKHAKDKAVCGFCMSTMMIAGRMLGENGRARKITEFMMDYEASKFEARFISADFALYEGDAKQAEEYLDAERPTLEHDYDDVVTYYQQLAVSKFLIGKKEEARLSAQNLVDQPRFANNLMASMEAAWIFGWIDLHDEKVAAATVSLQKALTLSDVASDKITAALARRALGEIAYLEKDYVEAAAQFKRVNSLCAAMGVLPSMVFDCGWAYWRLDVRFDGWKTFLEHKHPFSREQS